MQRPARFVERTPQCPSSTNLAGLVVDRSRPCGRYRQVRCGCILSPSDLTWAERSKDWKMQPDGDSVPAKPTAPLSPQLTAKLRSMMRPRGPTTQLPFRRIDWRIPARLRLHPIVFLFAALVVGWSWLTLPIGGLDWRDDIAPAARHWWPAPWTEGLPLLPWAGMLFSPLAGLPDRPATALLNGASVVVLALVVRHFGGPSWLAVPLLASPFGFWMFRNGQTDCLILGGLLFFNGLDPLIFALKPQVAIGALVARFKRAGVDRWRYVMPFGLALVVSLVIWWGWPLALLGFADILVPSSWNWSLWPYGLLVGLILLWQAWRTGDDRWGVAASPFLFPYVNAPSFLGLLAVIAARWPRWTMMLWAIFVLAFGYYYLTFVTAR